MTMNKVYILKRTADNSIFSIHETMDGAKKDLDIQSSNRWYTQSDFIIESQYLVPKEWATI